MEDWALGGRGNLKAGPDGKGGIPTVEGVEDTSGRELAEAEAQGVEMQMASWRHITGLFLQMQSYLHNAVSLLEIQFLLWSARRQP